ncbi:MAG TPA: 2Fe-2S iron-sulfur cluster-binding protein [Falsiroseomonas sp.]|jgi:succinate dehydrogenase/fumarate reductase-like Fe-S protein|nr:2Fe-2S iron-sulfur cluster-binding protein [Falsiroseomonas sp.]
MSGFEEFNVTVRVWRQGPGDKAGGWQEWRVRIPRGDHVLNLLAAVRRDCDPSLCFPDHFCKIGTCGACGLVVDGSPALGCRALVKKPFVEVAPPRGRTILTDLLTEDAPR